MLHLFCKEKVNPPSLVGIIMLPNTSFILKPEKWENTSVLTFLLLLHGGKFELRTATEKFIQTFVLTSSLKISRENNSSLWDGVVFHEW